MPTLRVEWSPSLKAWSIRPRHWKLVDGKMTLVRDRVPLVGAASQAEAEEMVAGVLAGLDMGKEAPDAPTAKEPVTGAEYCQEWIKTQTYDSQPKDAEAIDRYLPPSPLAKVALKDARPKHAVEFIRWLKVQPSRKGGTLAPRTIRNVADVVRRAFNAAVIEEILAANPFDPVRGELPAIEDKDPLARAGWEYTWDQVALLCYDDRVPADRKVWNAILFGDGPRPGEACILRWLDWDRTTQPLTKLDVRRARKSTSRKIGATKTGAVKACPVPKALEAILTAWWESGWEKFYGRKPTLSDYIVPTSTFTPRDEHSNEDFKADCKAVGVPVHHLYCTRHTFISRSQADGGAGEILQWITHAPPKTAYNGYTRQDWGRLCAEVSKLRFPISRTAPGPENKKALVIGVGARGFEGVEGAPEHPPTDATIEQSASQPTAPVHSETLNNTSGPRIGPTAQPVPVDRDTLERALVTATLGGHHAVAEQLAAILKRLQDAERPQNVVALNTSRPRHGGGG